MKKMSKKIVFFGNEKLATGIPEAKPIIRDAVEAAGFVIEQHVTGKLHELREHEAELAVLAAYGRIIPKSVLEQFPLGIINVHPSLLPAYRGPTPIEQAILDGVTRTGVSIMRLSPEMDEGPIYKQKTLQLSGKESKAELAVRLQALGAELLTEVLQGAVGGELKPRKQPHPDRATYSKLIRKEDGRIDWTKPAESLEREIRAYLDWPKSTGSIAGKDIVITKARVVPGTGKAGDFTIIDKDFVVFCGQDGLLIERLKPAGKNEMNAEAFINGYIR
jgi:methionyl-tRNA formyltransferase